MTYNQKCGLSHLTIEKSSEKKVKGSSTVCKKKVVSYLTKIKKFQVLNKKINDNRQERESSFYSDGG